jgi:hypothetical protein
MASAKRYPQMCDWAAQRSSSAASFLQTVERERVMGVNTDYLGHVEIVPNLNQASTTICMPSRAAAGATGPEGLTP